MIVYDPRVFTDVLFRLKGSVVKEVWRNLLVSALFGLAAHLLAVHMESEDEPLVADKVHSYLSFPLSFLLIFRSNLAYARYWEGRGFVGAMVRNCKDICRHMNTCIMDEGERWQQERAEIRRMVLVIFRLFEAHVKGASTKDKSYRNLKTIDELTDEERQMLQPHNNQVLIATQWLSRRIHVLARLNKIPNRCEKWCEENIEGLISAWMGCLKIINTPMPFPWVQMLHFFLVFFVYSLPFTYHHLFGWYTPLCNAFIGWAMFGIYAVGVEIENPFGDDNNDLPLHTFFITVQVDTLLLLQDRDPTAVLPETAVKMEPISSDMVANVNGRSTTRVFPDSPSQFHPSHARELAPVVRPPPARSTPSFKRVSQPTDKP